MSRRTPGSFAGRALHALAGSPDGTLLTDELIFITEKPGHWDDPKVVRQRALARMGNILRDLEEASYVDRAGETEAHWQQPSKIRWHITPAGYQLIAWWADAPKRAAHQEFLLAERRQRYVADEAIRALLETTRLKYTGQRITIEERRRICGQLRAAGCSLREIGDVFGITGEMVRMDTRPGREPSASRRTVMIGAGQHGRGKRWMKTMDESGPMAGLVSVTLTEPE